MEIIVVGVCVEESHEFTDRKTGEVRQEVSIGVKDGNRMQVWSCRSDRVKGPLPSVGDHLLVLADYVVTPQFRFAASVRSAVTVAKSTAEAWEVLS